MTDYVRTNPSISLSELKKIFPDEIQYDSFMNQKYGVVQTETLVRQQNWDKHFFTNSNEKINLHDTTILISREWGANNISKFLNAAENAGIQIKKNI